MSTIGGQEFVHTPPFLAVAETSFQTKNEPTKKGWVGGQNEMWSVGDAEEE